MALRNNNFSLLPEICNNYGRSVGRLNNSPQAPPVEVDESLFTKKTDSCSFYICWTVYFTMMVADVSVWDNILTPLYIDSGTNVS